MNGNGFDFSAWLKRWWFLVIFLVTTLSAAVGAHYAARREMAISAVNIQINAQGIRDNKAAYASIHEELEQMNQLLASIDKKVEAQSVLSSTDHDLLKEVRQRVVRLESGR